MLDTAFLYSYTLSLSKNTGSFFAFGYSYQKVGVMLTSLVPAGYRQKGIFVNGPSEKLIKLAGVVDKINHWHGQDKLRLASPMYSPDWLNAANVFI
ncbi:hypothetical protein [Spirosoma agri]|uniref:hypothetical protein n=1 Tax=Spirosoma agri TaxID=1987381 RepID=UPI001FEAB60F|nr:hypothetical protein [Spirosoma agri]